MRSLAVSNPFVLCDDPANLSARLNAIAFEAKKVQALLNVPSVLNGQDVTLRFRVHADLQVPSDLFPTDFGDSESRVVASIGVGNDASFEIISQNGRPELVDQVKGWSTYQQTIISPTEIDFVFQH